MLRERNVYRDKNPEKVKATVRAFFQTPEGKQARVNDMRRRRALKMGCETVAAANEIKALLDSAINCKYCRIPFDEIRKPTLDHIIPLSKCGPHSLENFAAACGSCNSKKGAKLDYALDFT